MRIASSQYSTTMNSALQNASARLEEIMQKMSTGQKLLLPSDDPVTNVRLSRITRQEASVNQYRSNISALNVRLQQNETHLDSLNSDMQEARDLMVWALDGGNSSDDLKAMYSSLQSLSKSLLNTANSKDDEGRYLFAGTASYTVPIAYDATAPAGSRYSYAGNTGAQNVVVGNGVTEQANVNVSEMATVLNQLDSTVVILGGAAPQVSDPATRAQFQATLDSIDFGMNSVSSKIASIGGAQNVLATLDSSLSNVSVSNQQAMIDLGQLDYGDAATKLNGYSTAVQATQKAYAQVSKLSLFDAI
jgi:flagellar hook-associated protein 3 FlgL